MVVRNPFSKSNLRYLPVNHFNLTACLGQSFGEGGNSASVRQVVEEHPGGSEKMEGGYYTQDTQCMEYLPTFG